MNNIKFRRFLAFIIDIYLVLIFSALISSLSFLNPNVNKVVETNEKYNLMLQNPNDYDAGTYNEDVLDLQYKLIGYNLIGTFIEGVVIVGYFGLFQKYNNGQTLGRKFFKLSLVNEDQTDLKVITLIGRYFFLTLFFMNVVTLVSYPFVSKNIFLNIYTYAFMFYVVLNIINASMIIFKEKGLYDKIFKTKVIDLKVTMN